MRGRTAPAVLAQAFIGALALFACSEEASPTRDSRLPADSHAAADGGAVDADPGTSCAGVQTCAQSCVEPGYADCVAACRAPASEKAQALLAAYDACAAATVAGECKEECAAGAADQACGQCVLPRCITQWNDCRLDE